MIRNKIEKWILSEHHVKNPTLVFILTLFSAFIILGCMLFYIAYMN